MQPSTGGAGAFHPIDFEQLLFRPHLGRSEFRGRLVQENAGLVVPSPQMATEPAHRFFREINENRFNADFNGSTLVIQISAAVKIVFINDRPTEKALGPENEVQSLAHGRLSNIVSADEQSVPGEIYTALRDAPEICNLQPPNAHFIPAPRLAPLFFKM